MINLITKTQKEYSLVDSGDGEKLERFGDFLIIRPETQALWQKKNPDVWQKANAIFTKDGWKLSKGTPENFEFEIHGIKALINFGKGRNLGVFPEYSGEWNVLEKVLKTKTNPTALPVAGLRPRVLNLFAYTGLSSIVCAKAGASVVHVDSSRTSNETAKKLSDENGVGDKIRFITEDSLSFMKKEGRRENKYDLIILDPPTFGRGNKGQVFKIEEKLAELILEAKKLLSENPMGIILSGYSSEFTSLSYSNVLAGCTGMETVHGTLSIEEEGERLSLPLAKWAFAFNSQEIGGIISELINN